MRSQAPDLPMTVVAQTEKISNDLTIRGVQDRRPNLHSVLSLVIARFATVWTVVLTILTEPHGVVGMAEGTIAIADTMLFGKLAYDTAKYFFGHGLSALIPRVQDYFVRASFSDITRANSILVDLAVRALLPGDPQAPSSTQPTWIKVAA